SDEATEQDEGARGRVDRDRGAENPVDQEVRLERRRGTEGDEREPRGGEIPQAPKVRGPVDQTVGAGAHREPAREREDERLREVVRDVHQEYRRGREAGRIEVRRVGDVEQVPGEVEQERR